MQRHDNVRFEFLGGDDALVALRGTVIVRDDEMVLEVECRDDRPYSIRGTPRRGFFIGRHEGLPGDVAVEAKWTRLDDIFIGTWVEGGMDYVFKFRLPRVIEKQPVRRSLRDGILSQSDRRPNEALQATAKTPTAHERRVVSGTKIAMRIAAGVDGCRDGWLCISRAEGADLRSALYTNAADLFSQEPMPELIAIDIPIGLTDSGGRECDGAARRMLGRRACCVFSAPIRPVLGAEDYAEANRMRVEVEGKKMSAQAWGIVKKVCEVDHVLYATPALQVRVREVHPEVCFMAWNGGTVMSERKRSPAGKAARKRLVETHFGAGAFDKVRASYARRAVADDDINDAFAALWTAERILNNCAKFIPEQPTYDSRRLRMEMWY